MKRNLISMFIGAAAICCGSYASSTPYVGMDFQMRNAELLGPNAKIHNQRPLAINAHFGKMLDNNFALEGGYRFSKSMKNGGRMELKALHGTFMGYLPVTITPGLSLIGGFGLSNVQHKVEHKLYQLYVSGAVTRILAGFEYKLMSNLTSRFAFDWENAKSLTKEEMRFNNIYGLSAGLKYSFL